MLQLAGKAWKLSLGATLRRLLDLGFNFSAEERKEDALRQYERRKVERQLAAGRVLSLGRSTILQPSRLGALLVQVGLLWTSAVQRSALAELIGGCLSKEAETELEGHLSKRKLFSSARWHEVLFAPYYDLPGRISGLEFFGQVARKDGIQTRFESMLPRDDKEAGLCFRPKVFTERGTVFAVEGAINAIRLQLKHQAANCSFAPVVAWRHDETARTSQAWRMFKGRKVVFLLEKLDARAWRQIMLADGHVYLQEPGVRGSRVGELLVRAEQKARPWPAMFEVFVDRAMPEELEDLLLQLRLYGTDLQALLIRCRESVRKRMLQLLSLQSEFKSIPWNTTQLIEERNNQLFLVDTRRGTDQLAASAVLQIDAMTAVDGRMYYRGCVRSGSRSEPFFANRSDIRKNPGAWLESFVAEHEMGTFHCMRSLSGSLVDIAKRLYEPKTHKGFRRVGWNEDKRTLVLPEIGLCEGGKTLAVDVLAESDRVPAVHLKPTALIPADVQPLLADTAANRTFWAAWLPLVRNILAPLLNVPRLGLAVVGDGNAAATTTAASGLGCVNPSFETARVIAAAEKEHDWPIWLNAAGNVSAATLKRVLDVNAFGDRNLAVRVSGTVADLLLVNGDFQALRFKSDEVTKGLTLYAWEAAAKLFVPFMRWLLTDLPQRYKIQTDPQAALAAAVERWLREELNLENSLPSASLSQLLTATPSHGPRFLKFLAAQCRARRLEITDSRKSAAPKLLRSGEGLVVEYQEVAKLCQRFRWPALRASSVSAQLAPSAPTRKRWPPRATGLFTRPTFTRDTATSPARRK
jgi:hypothetical protein